jgi:invasion protein IalB
VPHALTRRAAALSGLAALLILCSRASAEDWPDEASQPQVWSSACVGATRTDIPTCFIQRQFILQGADAPAGSPSFSMTLRFDVAAPGTPALMTIVLPLGLDLERGLIVGIGEAEPGAVPFYSCEPDGCRARLHLTPDQLASMKQAQALSLSFRSSDGPDMNVTVPPDGFAAAIGSVE